MLNVRMRHSAVNPRLGFGTKMEIDDGYDDLKITVKRAKKSAISSRPDYKAIFLQGDKPITNPLRIEKPSSYSDIVLLAYAHGREKAFKTSKVGDEVFTERRLEHAKIIRKEDPNAFML